MGTATKVAFFGLKFKIAAGVLLVLILGALLFSIVAIGMQAGQLIQERLASSCGAPSGAVANVTVESLTQEQSNNAATIINVGSSLALSPVDTQKAQVIAIATAMQESQLKNIDYGDRDSVGLFQQRTSQGWGTIEQIMDPVYSSRKFYEGLLKVEGWQQMPVTVAAQKVQRSAFPDAYAKWERLAVDAVKNLTGNITATEGEFQSLCAPGAVSGIGADPTLQLQPGGIRPGQDSLRSVYAKEQVMKNFGCKETGRQPCVTTIGGYANRGDGGKSDHNRGLAIDIMIGSGCVPGQGPQNTLGDQIEKYMKDNAAPFAITYTIWEDTEWSARTQSESSQNKYTGENASNCTYSHQDHVHVSFRAD